MRPVDIITEVVRGGYTTGDTPENISVEIMAKLAECEYRIIRCPADSYTITRRNTLEPL